MYPRSYRPNEIPQGGKPRQGQGSDRGNELLSQGEPQNNLLRYLQMAQSSGGSPYDEEAYQNPYRPVNDFLNRRMQGGGPQNTMQAAQGGPPGSMTLDDFRRQYGRDPATDQEMYMMYGGEDQVAMDPQGRPIPLADPRHPNNQRGPSVPMYPQRR